MKARLRAMEEESKKLQEAQVWLRRNRSCTTRQSASHWAATAAHFAYAAICHAGF